MTLKEIAQEAGVSISTVSRVINRSNKSVASQEVQERIWEIVRRTGYTPNSTARELKKGSSQKKYFPAPSLVSLPVSPARQQMPFLPHWHEVSKKKHLPITIF